MTLEWSGSASLTVGFNGSDQDLSKFEMIGFRGSENFNSPLQPPVEDVVTVTLTDASGASHTVDSSTYSKALEPEPGTTARKQVLNGVRVALNGFVGVDLHHVRTVTLGFGSGTAPTGSIQFADLALGEVPGRPVHRR